MLAPEDDIKIHKKEVVYENITYKKFENLVKKYIYYERVEIFLLSFLVLSTSFSSYYIYQIASIFQSNFEAHIELMNSSGHLVWFLVTNILLWICSYQVLKSLDNLEDKHKLPARYYIFQTIKIAIYVLTMLHLYFVFAIVALARIILIYLYSHSKSFE